MEGLRAACRAVFGGEVAGVNRLHGGDLSEVTRVTLEVGRVVVAKAGPMVDREARMLTSILSFYHT